MSLSTKREIVRIFPTPLYEDLIFYQVLDRKTDADFRFEYGSPHPQPHKFPNHILVFVEADDANGVEKRYYAAAREGEDAYNWQHTHADIGEVKFDAVARGYVILRSEYDPDVPAMGDPMPNEPEDLFGEGYILAERRQSRIQQQNLDSMFVVEERVYVKRADIIKSEYDPNSGTTTSTTRRLYHRGETVVFEDCTGPDSQLVEFLFDNFEDPFWKGDCDEIKSRSGQQLSEEWYAIDELRVSFTNNPKISRILDNATGTFIKQEVTPVDAGTDEAGFDIPTQQITETVARDYLQSEKKVDDYELPGQVYSGYEFDSDLNVMIQVNRYAAQRGTVTGSNVDGALVEVRPHNPVIDLILESSLYYDTGTYPTLQEYLDTLSQTVPAIFNYNFPRILQSARIVGCKAWASAGTAQDFAVDYYLETNMIEPTATSVRGRVIRLFTTAAGLADILDDPAYTTWDWGAKQETFGIVRAWAFASSNPDNAVARANAQQYVIPASIHDDIEIDLTFTGGLGFDGDESGVRTLSLPATPNYEDWPEWITIDVDPIPRRLGIYEVQIKQVWTDKIGGGTGGVPPLPALFAPVPLTPQDGLTNVDLTTSFTWSGIAAAASYTWEYTSDADTGFTTPIQTVVGNTDRSESNAAPMSQNTYYRWRVKALNGGVNPDSPWSPAFRFRTGGTPATPEPETPVDNATGVELTPPLDWEAGTGGTPPTGYFYETSLSAAVGGGGSFTSVLHSGSTSSTSSVTLPVLIPGTEYFWHVRASNTFGNGSFCAVQSFTTEGIISGMLPADGTTGIPTAGQFMDWDSSFDPEITAYDIEIWDNVGLAGSPVESSSGAASDYTIVGPLTAATQYWWRVRAKSSAGDGPWSTLFDFTTA